MDIFPRLTATLFYLHIHLPQLYLTPWHFDINFQTGCLIIFRWVSSGLYGAFLILR